MSKLAPSSFSWLNEMKVVEYDNDDHHMINECDHVNAAQKSDEETKIDNIRGAGGGSKRIRRQNDDIVMAKIQEIFGKDVEVFPIIKKQRRYRSLVNIYRATTPINHTRVPA
ncbi:hypothetical protein TSUD_77970 [Trifolium subterraneum]|uniref:Uncharacterized protein n=1 Tax=Trifolium subterraneum TaxID=3900 RepID=A0A2Z6MC09_TRISU|nr:hypothetical protein TSUD_77970 [Trifolium subterraneum]